MDHRSVVMTVLEMDTSMESQMERDLVVGRVLHLVDLRVPPRVVLTADRMGCSQVGDSVHASASMLAGLKAEQMADPTGRSAVVAMDADTVDRMALSSVASTDHWMVALMEI